MPLKPVFIAPIRRDVRRTVRRLCRELDRLSDVHHNVEVVVVPAPAVKRTDGACGFGGFAPMTCQIFLAGRHPADVAADDWLELVAETLCHELVHYEQWRDGRPFTERGVEVRARNLLAKASYTCAGTPA